MTDRGGAPWRLLVLGALTVPWLTGCTLLGFPPGWDGEEFPEPSVLAVYTEGTATIAIVDGETITLDVVEPDSSVTDVMGATAHWSGGGGWHLRIAGGQAEEPFGGSFSFLTFDRVVEGEHWTTFDPSRCVVDVEVADKSAFRGTATCRNVLWHDALGGGFAMPEPSPLGEPPFDAEITFEARP